MAKKKKQQQSTTPVLTRGQLSRAAREKKQEQLLFRIVGGIGAFVVLVLGLAAFSTFVAAPNEEMAHVGNASITRAQYEKFRRYNLFQQERTSAFFQQQGASGSGMQAPEAIATQLASVSTDPVDGSTIDQMIDNEVLRQKAQSDFQLTASKDDLKAQAIKDFLPSPTPPVTPEPTQSSITGTATLTPTHTLTPTKGPSTATATTTATLPPVAGASATAAAGYTSALTQISQGAKISEDDYLNLVIQPAYLKDKVTEKLSTGVLTQTEEIHAQHILTDTQAGAEKIIKELDGGADFTQLANTQSSEQINNAKNGQPVNGGDLGFFPREGSNLVTEFVEGAWPVKAGEYTHTPVKTSFGYHVIKVLERDPHHPLTEQEITSKKDKLYQDWLTKSKSSLQSTIRYSDKVQRAAPVSTQPAVSVPTPASNETTLPASTTGASTPAATVPAATTPASTP